jgi:hypothetical protein
MKLFEVSVVIEQARVNAEFFIICPLDIYNLADFRGPISELLSTPSIYLSIPIPKTTASYGGDHY